MTKERMEMINQNLQALKPIKIDIQDEGHLHVGHAGAKSGGHFNPAVSVMMAAAGKVSMKDLAPYVIAQIAGGLAALELYKRVKF